MSPGANVCRGWGRGRASADKSGQGVVGSVLADILPTFFMDDPLYRIY